jgi:hypothetical protein
MEFQNFLSDLNEDDVARMTWWERFNKAESNARECIDGWEQGKLDSVVKSDKTCWCPNGTLHIRGEDLQKGSLYHELFHTVLHNSAFKKKAEANDIDYRLYCECLCNSFEYFMERTHGPSDGEWKMRIEKWNLKNWAEILAESSDLSYDMTYGLPALEFIRACSTFAEFKELIANMNKLSS